MGHDAGRDMKSRMRADLRAAMKERRTHETRLIRALVAAIDNAEAPPLQGGRAAVKQHQFAEGSAEIERISLSPAQVRVVLLEEARERERAADELDSLARQDQADALRAEALLARRYINDDGS